MNNFDATKANADPRSVALSDEVYAALGVTQPQIHGTHFREYLCVRWTS